jgi:hypothetical protein
MNERHNMTDESVKVESRKRIATDEERSTSAFIIRYRSGHHVLMHIFNLSNYEFP